MTDAKNKRKKIALAESELKTDVQHDEDTEVIPQAFNEEDEEDEEVFV